MKPVVRIRQPEQLLSLRTPFELSRSDIRHELIWHPPVYRPYRRSLLLRIPLMRVLKCVLVFSGREPMIAAFPADRRIDLSRLSAVCGSEVRLALPSELGKWFPDCERGVASAFGSLYHLPTIVEAAIDWNRSVVLPCQLSVASLRLNYADYLHFEQPRRLHFTYVAGTKKLPLKSAEERPWPRRY